MRRTRLARRSDGLLHVECESLPQRVTRAGAVLLVGLPAVVMVIVALVAVLPIVVLVLPAALAVGIAFPVSRRLAHGGHEVARVIPFRP